MKASPCVVRPFAARCRRLARATAAVRSGTPTIGTCPATGAVGGRFVRDWPVRLEVGQDVTDADPDVEMWRCGGVELWSHIALSCDPCSRAVAFGP